MKNRLGGPVVGVSVLKDWSYCGMPGYTVCTADAPVMSTSPYQDHPDAVFETEFYQPNWWGVGESDRTTRSWKCPHCGATVFTRGAAAREG